MAKNWLIHQASHSPVGNPTRWSASWLLHTPLLFGPVLFTTNQSPVGPSKLGWRTHPKTYESQSGSSSYVGPPFSFTCSWKITHKKSLIDHFSKEASIFQPAMYQKICLVAQYHYNLDYPLARSGMEDGSISQKWSQVEWQSWTIVGKYPNQ